MLPNNTTLQLFGYGSTTVAFLILGALLVLQYRDRIGGVWLSSAALTTSAWGALMCWAIAAGSMTPLRSLVLEMMLDGAWIAFLSVLLVGAIGGDRQWLARYGGVSLVLIVVSLGVIVESSTFLDLYVYVSASEILVLGSIITSLVGLISVEQIYRNSRDQQKSSVKFLCIGVAAIFAYDLVMYSHTILIGQISESIWLARGIAFSICAALIALAARRSPDLRVGLFVSRHVVFYSATLISAGIYLAIIGMAGQYFQSVSDDWGDYLQVVVTFAALLGLVVFLISERSRRYIRVSINKHFFESSYDYRAEWLRLTGTLTGSDEGLPLKKRAIKALAQIQDAQSGILWLSDIENSTLYSAAGWNCSVDADLSCSNHALAEFLQRTGWIVDVAEYTNDPDRYEGLDMNASALGIENPGLIVPLLNHGDILGLIVLATTERSRELNFEDRDILKAAGQQVASYLAQDLATDKLAEGKQFEAFNRLTAYLMHDLKNVIAQQSLIVDNSSEHKDKPEFVDDMIETIKGSVRRMRGLIDHLQQRTTEQVSQRIEVTKVILQAVSQCADRNQKPRVFLGDGQIWVNGDPDRLQMAIFHAIRNAQDASDESGRIDVSLSESDDWVTIVISDEGSGMDEKFVRERLFRPFDSTKGTQGMGIGAYQLRETVTAFGGEISIDSRPGEGTSLVIILPRSSTSDAVD